jgi:hypothetical protein
MSRDHEFKRRHHDEQHGDHRIGVAERLGIAAWS